MDNRENSINTIENWFQVGKLNIFKELIIVFVKDYKKDLNCHSDS